MKLTMPMLVRDLYQLEVAGRVATMYINGRLTHGAAPTLRDACDALPANVHVLCVSVTDDALDVPGPQVLRQLRLHWRETRGGPFRLAIGRSSVRTLSLWGTNDGTSTKAHLRLA